MNYKTIVAVSCWLVVLAAAAFAQAPTPPVSYSSIAELNQMLSNLQQASQATQEDLSRLRIEKWKTDSDATNLPRSEEHTSELQSHLNLVCRLLLEKKKRHAATHQTSY